MLHAVLSGQNHIENLEKVNEILNRMNNVNDLVQLIWLWQVEDSSPYVQSKMRKSEMPFSLWAVQKTRTTFITRTHNYTYLTFKVPC